MRILSFTIWSILLTTCLSSVVLQGQGGFVTPMSGSYGDEYVIVNYVDWGEDTTIQDAYCLTKTYDGHQGTDFVIRNFALMDAGVAVLAVDTGVVIFTQDGIFDREKSSDPAKGLGNYIGITHAGDYQTYYGHLRKNSLLVSAGDTVMPGQTIAYVGSSGNSEDPHLHFELWFDSLYLIDPFSGPCGNATTFWKDAIPVDSLFHQWISGMVGFIPDIDTLREQPVLRDTFYQEDKAITYWSLIYGLRQGDHLHIEWTNPDGVLWYMEDLDMKRDWWYYYYWSWINSPPPQNAGLWMVRFFRNGVLAEERPFTISEATTSVHISDTLDDIILRYGSGTLQLAGQGLSGCRYELLSVVGIVVEAGIVSGQFLQLNTTSLSPGVYVLHVVADSGEQRAFKVTIP